MGMRTVFPICERLLNPGAGALGGGADLGCQELQISDSLPQLGGNTGSGILSRVVTGQEGKE